MGSGDDPPRKRAAVVVERHIEKLGADLRALSRRAPGTEARENPADIAKTPGSERRPAKQAGAEDADRDSDSKLATKADEAGDWQRGTSAAANRGRGRLRRPRSGSAWP